MICYKCRQDTVEGPRGGVYPSPGVRLCSLHAAAPALLEALEAATDDATSPVYHSRGCSQHLKGRMGSIRRPCDCGFSEWLEKARAAIRLATGGSVAQAKGESNA